MMFLKNESRRARSISMVVPLIVGFLLPSEMYGAPQQPIYSISQQPPPLSYMYGPSRSPVNSPYAAAQSSGGATGPKFNINGGYNVHEKGETKGKVKKAYGSKAGDELFDNDLYTGRFGNELSQAPSPGLLDFSFNGGAPLPKMRNFGAAKSFTPQPVASSKIYIPDHHHHHHPYDSFDHHDDFDHFLGHEKPHLAHDFVSHNVHLVTGAAGHKLKQAGEVLESGAVTDTIVHKLPFIKAALLQLLAIIGPLSAAKTIHVVAQASHSSNPHHEEPAAPPSAPEGIPPSAEGVHHGHHPLSLTGLILNIMGQLSRFNTDAKLHLVPNLVRIISTSSQSSAHSSAHY